MSWLVFDVGTSRFALPSEDLLAVVSPDALVRVPGAAPEVSGALAVRQEVIAVVDLARLLGAATTAPARHVLVLRPLERQLGVVAGELCGLHELEPERSGEGVAVGECVIDGRPVTLVDTERLCAATGGRDA